MLAFLAPLALDRIEPRADDGGAKKVRLFCRDALRGIDGAWYDRHMTNNNTTPRPMTHAERLAFYSNATPEVNPIPTKARRTPPKARRHSVRHRSIR